MQKARPQLHQASPLLTSILPPSVLIILLFICCLANINQVFVSIMVSITACQKASPIQTDRGRSGFDSQTKSLILLPMYFLCTSEYTFAVKRPFCLLDMLDLLDEQIIYVIPSSYFVYSIFFFVVSSHSTSNWQVRYDGHHCYVTFVLSTLWRVNNVTC